MVTRTGVTKQEFSEEFASEEGLFCAAFDHGQALIAQTLIAAIRDQRRWLSRVRSAAVSTLRFFDAEPQWAELMLLTTPSIGAGVLERREHALNRLAQLLERGAPKSAEFGLAPKSGLTAQLVIGGAFSVIQRRLLEHRGMPLIELAPSLMSLIVLPYLGAQQANAELTRKLIPKAGSSVTGPELPRRASYRTTLVLKAIATCPGANNRAIAQAAGLSDEGQTSKLLSRLRRQGLIENVGLGQAYGEPNAWLLTSNGARVAREIGQGLASGRVPKQAPAKPAKQKWQAKDKPQAALRHGRTTCQS